ncbi:hypothetical protein Mapa_005440 [Marchantia paleacea]|nr:hypothetical protein Mapa_005440 [Marchantia paleacea]
MFKICEETTLYAVCETRGTRKYREASVLATETVLRPHLSKCLCLDLLDLQLLTCIESHPSHAR